MSDTAIFKALVDVFAKKAQLKDGKFYLVCEIQNNDGNTEILECYFKPINELFVPGFSDK